MTKSLPAPAQRIMWEHPDKAPYTHIYMARILIAMPGAPLERVARLTQLTLSTVRDIAKHPPFIEYVERKKLENLDTYLAAQEMFPQVSSEAMLIVQEIMNDGKTLDFARLKAAEILLSRDPHQLFPDKSKLKDQASDATAIHSTEAIESVQGKGQLMRDRAERRLIDVTPPDEDPNTPIEAPEDHQPAEAEPDEPIL